MRIGNKMRNEVKIQETIDLLNEALEADHAAISRLFDRKVFCNEQLANHSTIQVEEYSRGTLWMVGILGLLNGLFGVDQNGYGPIVAVYDEAKILVRFDRFSPDMTFSGSISVKSN